MLKTQKATASAKTFKPAKTIFTSKVDTSLLQKFGDSDDIQPYLLIKFDVIL